MDVSTTNPDDGVRPPIPEDNGKDDVVLCIHAMGKHFVLPVQGASTVDLVAMAKEHVLDGSPRYSREREKALVLAHNIDNGMRTVHGVREVFIGGNNSKKRRAGET